MSSCTDLTFITPQDPLSKGHYFLLDCSQAIDAYLQVPSAIRLEALSDGEEAGEYDMIDIELSEVFPTLTTRDYIGTLDYLITGMLDDSLDRNQEDLIELGIYEPDMVVENTQLQIRHADAIEQLTHDVAKTLEQNGFYGPDGVLNVEYVTLLKDGVVALRRAEYHY